MAAEKNYIVVERECLAIKWALDFLWYFLLSGRIQLVSDHVPLIWMRQNKQSNATVTRRFLSPQEFDLVLEHRPGTSSKKQCMVSNSQVKERTDVQSSQH